MPDIIGIGTDLIVPTAVKPNSITDPMLAQSGGILERLETLEDVTTNTVTESETITEQLSLTWTAGYVTNEGVLGGGDTYQYSQKVQVSEGDVIDLFKQDSAHINFARYVTAYNGTTVVSAGGGITVPLPFTVPSGVDGVVFTVQTVHGVATGTRERTTTTETLQPVMKPDVDTIYGIVASADENGLTYKFDLAANGTYATTEQFEDQCAYRITFFAKISSFTGETVIGKGIGVNYGGGIGFDGTNLYQYFNTGATPLRTQAHGLTLRDYVSIVLDAGYSPYNVKCTIVTNGGSYEWTIPFWRSFKGNITITTASALSGCILSYACAGLAKDTWVYGDSYLNTSGTDRWSSYLVTGGYENYLLNGYAGRNSAAALASLHVDLSMNRIPRRIVWCLGMNDKDGSDAPNASWQTAVEEVMQICEKNHIELVLATIPNVPSTTTKNTLKNAYVVESGYRYIDFANAVSANGDSTWYDGMLNEDNVHPNVQGALALYSMAVSTVPELLF